MDDGTIRVWDTASGLQVLDVGQERIGGSTEHAAGVAFGPGDQWLAATRGPEVTLWDLPSGTPLVKLKGSEASAQDELRGGWGVSSLAVSPDGEWLAASTWYYHPDAAGEFRLYRVRDFGLPAAVGALGAGLPTPSKTPLPETCRRGHQAAPSPPNCQSPQCPSSFRKSLPKMGLKQVEELPPRFWRLRPPEGGRYVFAVSQGHFHATRAEAG
jgi:hypothetical protein